ncbi:DMT family transporter [Xanthocytophaga flava]|uniref:DMT family transporter n=1 Tax=Xanthocytophaga flava TaxID=3048013 RepID=UPI0028D62BD8|nr:DMT family transporter [Xanthocytophaga flavus]MDJ1469598.1 DMT family transporter [Xanthocytophaga flavus]
MLSTSTSRYTPATLVWIAFVLLTLTWGSSFILIKKGLQSYSTWQVATLRLVSASVIMIPLALVYIRQIPKEKIQYVVLSSLLSMFTPAYLFCAGQTGLSSSIVGVLNALTPGFTFLVGVLFFHQRSRWIQIAGLLVGLAGTLFLVLITAQGTVVLNGYAILIVLATVSYGFNINIIKNHLASINPVHLTTVTVSISGLLALLYSIVTHTDLLQITTHEEKTSFAAVVTLGIMGTAFAQLVFNSIIKVSSAVFFSSVTYFVPVIAVFWGVWDGEVLLLWHYLGILLIIVSVFILNKSR